MPRLYSRSISPSRSAIFFFTWLPHTAPELEPAASCSQASPGNPSPGAGGAGKDARCKSAQGSQPPSALTQVPESSQSRQRPGGPGEAGENGDSRGSFSCSAVCKATEMGGRAEGEDSGAAWSTPKSNYVQRSIFTGDNTGLNSNSAIKCCSITLPPCHLSAG